MRVRRIKADRKLLKDSFVVELVGTYGQHRRFSERVVVCE